MKIKTSFNREGSGNGAGARVKRTQRKPAVNRKPRLSARGGIASAFRLLYKVSVPALLIIFMIISIIYALRSDAFMLREIRVSGCVHQDAESLENILREEFPDNILRIDLGKAKAWLEKETWVKRVEVHRVLPSFLALRVEERKPAVFVELDGSQLIADGEGVLLGAYRQVFGKLDSPIFKGFTGDDPESYAAHYKENSGRIRRATAMLAEIAAELPEDVQKISELDVSDINNIKIIMENDPVEIFMGSGNYLKRFSSFVVNTKDYQELKNQGIQVAQIDLSNDGQIVYKSREAVAREKSLKPGRPASK